MKIPADRKSCMDNDIECSKEAPQRAGISLRNEDFDEDQDVYDMVIDEVPFAGSADQLKQKIL